MTLLGHLRPLGVALLLLSSPSLPKPMIGEWHVGVAYKTPGPIGIDARQEQKVRSIQITYATNRFLICGKQVQVKGVQIESLSENDFLQKFGFLPRLIGMLPAPVTEINVNSREPAHGCSGEGEWQYVGQHILIGQDGHLVIEVANAYFALQRSSIR